jgi:putative iron-regulated protein
MAHGPVVPTHIARFVTGALFALCACHATESRPHLDAKRVDAALETYADIAAATYTDAAQAWDACQHAIALLLVAPSPATLSAARQAWLQARVPYEQTEAFRFYGGPIDEMELQINTWPIDETFIEANSGQRQGIIDDLERYPDLNTELLMRLNGAEGETSISTGYHAVEFLLWGSDESATGPGARPYTDFVEHPGERLVPRRRRYLGLASALLGRQLDALSAAWRPGLGTGQYRAKFLALPKEQALGYVLKGMGTLSGPELARERITVPYETRDPQNEQSCFSDSTQADIVNAALGVQNLCAGRYARRSGAPVSGLGVCALFDASGRDLRTKIDAGVRAARAIPAPFDRAIADSDAGPGRKAIARAIAALEAQTTALEQVAAKYGLSAREQARGPR